MMTPAKFIRKSVLRTSQTELAAHLGVVQSSVARWEMSGFIPPRFHEQIRYLAVERNIDWQNIWLVEVPEDVEQHEAAA